MYIIKPIMTTMTVLQAFCVSAAICIALIFLLQVGRCHSLGENIFFQTSWFVAWLSLDQHRIEMRKHGIIPCVTVEKVFNFL